MPVETNEPNEISTERKLHATYLTSSDQTIHFFIYFYYSYTLYCIYFIAYLENNFCVFLLFFQCFYTISLNVY